MNFIFKMVNINKSTLNNSPIINNSPNTNIDNSKGKVIKSKKYRKNIFTNPWLITIVGGIIVWLIIFGITGGNSMTKNDTKINIEGSNLDKSPVIVNSPNTNVDNSKNIFVVTDKESLGIREANGLYQNGEKVGSVFNFNTDESSNTFTISSIEYYKPIMNHNSVWQPYEYQNYVIQIKNIHNLVTLMPSGATGVNGIILSKS